MDTQRSFARPERHFPDSFITVRLALVRAIAQWLPRCPACHQPTVAHDHNVRAPRLRAGKG